MKKTLLIALVTFGLQAETSFLDNVTTMLKARTQIAENSPVCTDFFYKLTACMTVMSERSAFALKPSLSQSKQDYQKSLGDKLVKGCNLTDLFKGCQKSIQMIEEKQSSHYANVSQAAAKQPEDIIKIAHKKTQHAEHAYLYKRMYRLFKGLNAHLFTNFSFTN